MNHGKFGKFQDRTTMETVLTAAIYDHDSQFYICVEFNSSNFYMKIKTTIIFLKNRKLFFIIH